MKLDSVFTSSPEKQRLQLDIKTDAIEVQNSIYEINQLLSKLAKENSREIDVMKTWQRAEEEAIEELNNKKNELEKLQVYLTDVSYLLCE